MTNRVDADHKPDSDPTRACPYCDERDRRIAALEGEIGELRLALAAEDSDVDLDAADAPRRGERDRLRLDRLRREHPAAVGLRRVRADEVQVARELIDGLDRPDPLDLDGEPFSVRVTAHQVDRPDVGRPFPPDETQPVLDRLRQVGERLLKMPLDAVLLEPRVLAQLVLELRE